MARRRQRVPVHIDSGDVTSLTDEELALVLHAADQIVHLGGRSMLVRLLKGSRDKKALEHGLDAYEMYGCLAHLTTTQVERYVDWTIEQGYLEVYYDKYLPFLAFTPKGWERERPVAERALFDQFCQDVQSGQLAMAERMEHIKNEVALDVIDMIGRECAPSCIPHLQAWSDVASKRIKKRIAHAMRDIEERDQA